MYTVINQFNAFALDDIGASRNVPQKLLHLQNIRGVPEDYNHDVINAIAEDGIEDFNNAFINIRAEISNFFQEYVNHGSINCGIEMANYIAIRNNVFEIWDGLDPGAQFNPILEFILSPIYHLPCVQVLGQLDKSRGEKTYSKMLLNAAVQLAVERVNIVEGYWTCRQQQFA
jgi:hypothetical protein